MNYTADIDDSEHVAGDPQETDGVNREDEMGPSGSDAHKKTGDDDIAGEIDEFLRTPRFQGDICITLSMPDTYLKKAKDKINLALWNAYNKYARTVERVDSHGNTKTIPGFGMKEIVMTLASRVDPVKFAQILENDVKQKIAEESGIKISDAELEYVAKHPIKFSDSVDDEMDGASNAGPAPSAVSASVTTSIVDCPECNGSGKVNGSKCRLCLGKGRVNCIVETIPAAAIEAEEESLRGKISSMDINMDEIENMLDGGTHGEL